MSEAVSLDIRSVGADHCLGGFRTQVEQAPRNPLNSFDQVFTCPSLENKTGGSCPQSFQNVTVLGKHGEDEDTRPRRYTDDLARGIQAVELGHGDVQQSNLRLQSRRQLYGLKPVGGLADYLETFSLQKNPKSFPHQIVIVG